MEDKKMQTTEIQPEADVKFIGRLPDTLIQVAVVKQPEGKDPLRYSTTGKPVFSLRCVLSAGRKEREENPNALGMWFTVQAWNELAKELADRLENGTLGKRLLCAGRFEVDNFEAEDGSNRQTLKFVANEIYSKVLPPKTDDQELTNN